MRYLYFFLLTFVPFVSKGQTIPKGKSHFIVFHYYYIVTYTDTNYSVAPQYEFAPALIQGLNGATSSSDTSEYDMELKLKKNWFEISDTLIQPKDIVLYKNQTAEHFELNQRLFLEKRKREMDELLEESYVAPSVDEKIALRFNRMFSSPTRCNYRSDNSFRFKTSLHEVDWNYYNSNLVDTMQQKSLFLDGYSRITLGNDYWSLFGIWHCLTYIKANHVDNNLFWHVRTNNVSPTFKPNQRGQQKQRLKNKATSAKLAGVKYTFSRPKLLYGSTDKYVVQCDASYKKKSYLSRIFVGSGSQLQFSNIVLTVQKVTAKDIEFSWRTVPLKKDIEPSE